MTVTVTNTNDLPIIVEEIEDLELSQNFGTHTIDLSNKFSDEDGDALTFSASTQSSNVLTLSLSETSLMITELNPGIAEVNVTVNDGNGGIINDLFSVTISVVSTVRPEELSESIKLYPNPTSDYIEFQSAISTNEDILFGLYSVAGHENRIEAQLIQNGKYLINVSKVQAGLYWLKADIGDQTIFKQVIIK